MDSVWLILPITVAVVVTVILKIVEVVEKRYWFKTFNMNVADIEIVDLLKMQISYDKFYEIANESLRPNGPRRKEDDFLDFVAKYIYEGSDKIENRLLRMGCED